MDPMRQCPTERMGGRQTCNQNAQGSSLEWRKEWRKEVTLFLVYRVLECMSDIQHEPYHEILIGGVMTHKIMSHKSTPVASMVASQYVITRNVLSHPGLEIVSASEVACSHRQAGAELTLSCLNLECSLRKIEKSKCCTQLEKVH